jgi:4-coumarate--CoA ligase
MIIPEFLAVASAAAKDVGTPLSNVILLESSVPGHQTLHELILARKSLSDTPPYQIPRNMKNSQVCGFLSFNSGTAGKPEAVSLHQVSYSP